MAGIAELVFSTAAVCRTPPILRSPEVETDGDVLGAFVKPFFLLAGRQPDRVVLHKPSEEEHVGSLANKCPEVIIIQHDRTECNIQRHAHRGESVERIDRIVEEVLHRILDSPLQGEDAGKAEAVEIRNLGCTRW